MDTKYIFRTALLSSVLLAAASCIYPFEPELPSVTEAPLVVEGDIHIGGQTTLRLSHVKSFTRRKAAPLPSTSGAISKEKTAPRSRGRVSSFQGASTSPTATASTATASTSSGSTPPTCVRTSATGCTSPPSRREGTSSTASSRTGSSPLPHPPSTACRTACTKSWTSSGSA